MGEQRGGNIAGHNGLDERGRRVMHAVFSHTRWSGGTAGGRRRVKQAYCFHTCRGKGLEMNGLPAGMGNGA